MHVDVAIKVQIELLENRHQSFDVVVGWLTRRRQREVSLEEDLLLGESAADSGTLAERGNCEVYEEGSRLSASSGVWSKAYVRCIDCRTYAMPSSVAS